jgi:hypothetical protein
VNTVVAAIFDAAKIIRGDSAGEKTKKALSNLRKMLLPEIEQEDERTTKDVEALLRKEAEKGPLHVKRMDSETRRKKR